MSNGKLSSWRMNIDFFWSNKKRVYEPGEEFDVQVPDDFVELVTKEEMGELPEEVDNKEVMPL